MVKQVNIQELAISNSCLELTLCTQELTGRSKAVILLWIPVLFLFHLSLRCAILAVPCSFVDACWEGLASRVWCFFFFCVCVILLLSHFYNSLILKQQ